MDAVGTVAVAVVEGASSAGSHVTNAYLKIEAPAPYVKLEVKKP